MSDEKTLAAAKAICNVDHGGPIEWDAMSGYSQERYLQMAQAALSAKVPDARPEHNTADDNCVQHNGGRDLGATCWICKRYDSAVWLTQREMWEARQ